MKTPHFFTGKITKVSLFLFIVVAMITTDACSKKSELTPADASKIEASRTETAHASDWQEHVNPKLWRAFYDTFRGKPDGGHTLRDDMNEVAFNALIQSGADINVRDEDGKTLLMATKEPDVIEALIKAGIDVNARDSEGRTALMYAARWGQYCDEEEDEAWFACKTGTGPCDEEEFAFCEDVYAEDVLIAAGADVNAKDNAGMTAIMHIRDLESDIELQLESHSTHFLRTLIVAGADVNARSDDQNTPLFYAVFPAHVKILVAAGADVNAKNSFGLTPLMTAELLETQSALIEAGADAKAVDNEGYPAFMHAYLHQFRPYSPDFIRDADEEEAPASVGVLQLFSKAGVDIHAKNQKTHESLSDVIKQTCSQMYEVVKECYASESYRSFDCEDVGREKLGSRFKKSLLWNACDAVYEYVSYDDVSEDVLDLSLLLDPLGKDTN